MIPDDVANDPYSLCRPDDSLGALRVLTNLAQFDWEEPHRQETTFILHNSVNLDEELAAATIPSTPGLRVRVKREPASSLTTTADEDGLVQVRRPNVTSLAILLRVNYGYGALIGNHPMSLNFVMPGDFSLQLFVNVPECKFF